MRCQTPNPSQQTNTLKSLDRSLFENPDSPRLNPFPSLVDQTHRRRKLRDSTISGTTLTHGDPSSGTIKRSTRVLTSESICGSDAFSDDSRDDKRFTEKKNKSERARRKKEDNVRLRTLVDEVLASDPRIKRIKADEKAARLAKKGGIPTTNGAPPKALTPAEKKKAEEARLAAEAATKEQEKKAAELSKAEKEAAKKAKEAARKNLKKWKKAS